MIPTPTVVNITHMLKYVGPSGLYIIIKGPLFLSNKGSHKASVWFGDRY